MNLRHSHWASALVLAALLAVLHTWPLATAPGTLSRNDNGDAQLNEWIIAWVQHQLVNDPRSLFQANIFFPARDALAFSEPLIVPALLGAPFRWLGGSPVLVHNLLLMLGLMLTMMAMYALIYEWTGDRIAALVAGSAFAFNTHTLTRIAHLQAMHAYGIPLALLAADRIITRGRTRDAVMLALWMTVMAYTSGHFPIFTFCCLLVAVVVRAREWMRAPVEIISRFALAAAITAAAVAPIYIPYRRVVVEQGMVRSLDAVGQFSVTLWSYLASGGRLHGALWSERWFQGIDAYFPGVAVFLLSIAALIYAWRTPRPAMPPIVPRRVLMLVTIAIVGVVLSLGTHTPVYGWFYQLFPPATAIRAASRFGSMFLFAVAALAGIGVWKLRIRLFEKHALPVGIAALVLVNAEALRAPFPYRPFEGFSRLYTLLKDEPGPVVLVEQPFYRPEAVFMNAEYVLNSSVHWRPLMNGYSGYTPSSYVDYAREFSSFPAPESIAAMRRAGVTHVMVHPARFGHGDEVMALCKASPALELIGTGRNGMTLFRLR